MKAVLQTIRILVIILLIEIACCQDGINNGDVVRYQQITSNDGQIETITSYNTNIKQRDPSSQAVSSVNVQYGMSDDNKNDEFNRADRGRIRKVYHIKNPFQQEESQKGEANTRSDIQDSGSAASNQYAAMQYSLPPEDFLQQMRAENQYYQQQQHSTSAPNIGYTATPQPQYQYSTISASNYENSNQPSNQIQMDPKTSHSQTFFPNPNNYQYNPQNIYALDNAQSTPSPITSFLSTSLPNSQFVSTPSNTYVSSSSPMFLSSSPNLQEYVSSPLSPIQLSSPTYGHIGITTTGSNSINYDNHPNKKMLIDHYDNSANGVRYPANVQQYQNDYPSSTSTPSSSPYSDPLRESWQNTMNAGINALSKSIQEVSLSQYQNLGYNNQQDTKIDSTLDSASSDTHRIGTLSPANNMYSNYFQPDYQALNNIKSRQRELQQESPQQDLYSNGDYGWKLTGKRPLISQNNYAGNYQKYPGINSQSDGGAISQMNFHLDTGKSYNYNQNLKPVSENKESQEFAKAAAKAQENMKQQQLYGNNYPINFSNINQNQQNSNAFYDNNERQKNKYPTGLSYNSYSYSTLQPDLITISPYYYGKSNENSVDNKLKQPFDHAKALKNIVPIDVSNVVQNNEAQLKALTGLDNNNRFNLPNLGNDQDDQTIKQYYRTIADDYYKDKNMLYGFNLKTKPEDFLTVENLKQLENTAYLGKHPQTQDSNNVNPLGFAAASQSVTYSPQVTSSYPENLQSLANFQQQGLSHPQNQISSGIVNLFKLNDVPYRITQSLSNDALKLQSANFDQTAIPTPLPMRINQNLGSHQLDVTSNLLNKLMLNKQPVLTINRPEIEGLSTINGYKVANPYNVDLKVFAEMLNGKPAVDDSSMLSLKDQVKPPIKVDLSQLQLLLRNENLANLAPMSDGLNALSNHYMDIYNNGRFPYQGVKYSRSQEEEETIIPIADATNSHPIGAVMEQDETEAESDVGLEPDTTAQADESFASYDEERTKKPLITLHKTRDRHRHPNALLSSRHQYQRKHPVNEPYPLLRPPPHHTSRHRGAPIKNDKYNRHRRVTKPKIFRILKTEPIYESDTKSDNEDASIPIILRPPPPDAEDKSDSVDTFHTS